MRKAEENPAVRGEKRKLGRDGGSREVARWEWGEPGEGRGGADQICN
jgi:hypothetical protein